MRGSGEGRAPPRSHERGAALRKKAVYKQLGRLYEITPEAEKIFKNLTVQEKKAMKRQGSVDTKYRQRVAAEGGFRSVKRTPGDG